MAPQKLAHIAHHQAGAFLALFASNQSLDVAKITLAGPVYAEGAALERPSGSNAVGTAEEAALATLVSIYAGYAAEERFDPERPALSAMMPEDVDRAIRLLQLLESYEPDGDQSRRMRERAVELVRHQWRSVQALAKELETRGSLTRIEAELVIEDARGCEPARSALRARRTSVSTLRVVA